MSQDADNLRGILLMLVAMAAFALGDVGIKALAGVVPPGQIMGSLGILGTVIFAFWTRARGLALFPRALWHPAIAIRFAFEVLAGISMVMALTHTPLSLLTAILQAAPLVVAMGGALFFREAVGPRRWAAISVGLLGVLIILRPGLSAFDPNALWAVSAMIALASRDLATRAAPKSLENLQLGTFGIFALVPTGLLLFTVTPGPIWLDVREWVILIFAILVTVGGYYTITAAMRVGEIGAVTPFRYSRLIFGLILGISLFGERPEIWTYVGAILIVGTGLYTIWRERRAS